MQLCGPLKLGPFVVDADGRLTPSTPERFPSFRIAWRGHAVEARLTAATPEGGVLALNTVLGRVRSTGRPEAPETLPRQIAFGAMRMLPETLPSDWTLSLLPDHRIRIEARYSLTLPTAAEDLLVELALFVLRLNPYLDLLAEEAGIEIPSPAASGGVWPSGDGGFATWGEV
jgi:hypothetical protein